MEKLRTLLVAKYDHDGLKEWSPEITPLANGVISIL